MKRISKEWLNAASIDITSIQYLLQDERLTGQVAFHAQQAIEKSLKAIIEEKGERVPKIHSLAKLFDSVEPFVELESNEDLIIALDSLYIESRYPGEQGLMPNGVPSHNEAERFYQFAKSVFNIISEQLNN